MTTTTRSVIGHDQVTRTGRIAATGALAGMAGAAAMAMYAMVVAGAVKHTGYLTPLYHIASSFVGGSAMMHSMASAMTGSGFYFGAGPALLGLVVHMMMGAMTGMIFAIAITRRPVPSALILAAGAAFGMLVLVVNSFVVLPIAAKVFGGGEPIAHMGRVVGWTHFAVEHLIYGMVLGVIVAAFGARRRATTA